MNIFLIRRIHLTAITLSIVLATLGCSSIQENPIEKNIAPADLRIALAVTDLNLGKNRIAFGVIEPGGGPIEDADVILETYFLDGNPDKNPVEILATVFRKWPTNQGGVYTTNATFSNPGSWGILARVDQKTGDSRIASAKIVIKKRSSSPYVGSKAPQSLTKTASLGDDMSHITSDPNPHMPLYTKSISEAVTSGKVSVILFATPAFCRTATCGPQVKTIASLEIKMGDSVNFLHVEIYDNPHKILGDITNAEVSPEVRKWNLPSEPWTFVVDSKGIVSNRFEGFATEGEIKEAISALTR